MQLIQLLKSPVTVAVLAVFHDLAIVPLAAGDGFPWIGFFVVVWFWGDNKTRSNAVKSRSLM